MSTVTRKRHTFIVPLLALLAAAIALVATTVTAEAVSGAPAEAEQGRVAPNVGVVSDLSDHCGGTGDLALIQATDVELASLQQAPVVHHGNGPGVGTCYLTSVCGCAYQILGICFVPRCWLELVCT